MCMNSQELTELSNLRILLNPPIDLSILSTNSGIFSCAEALSMHAMIFSIPTWSLNQFQRSIFNFWNAILANMKLMFRTCPPLAFFIQTGL